MRRRLMLILVRLHSIRPHYCIRRTTTGSLMIKKTCMLYRWSKKLETEGHQGCKAFFSSTLQKVIKFAKGKPKNLLPPPSLSPRRISCHHYQSDCKGKGGGVSSSALLLFYPP